MAILIPGSPIQGSLIPASPIPASTHRSSRQDRPRVTIRHHREREPMERLLQGCTPAKDPGTARLLQERTPRRWRTPGSKSSTINPTPG